MTVYTHKMQLERLLRTQDTFNSSIVAGCNAALLASNTSMKVFYQQEQDTQMYFPSSRESAAFKKQRDHFYSILGYVHFIYIYIYTDCQYITRLCTQFMRISMLFLRIINIHLDSDWLIPKMNENLFYEIGEKQFRIIFEEI